MGGIQCITPFDATEPSHSISRDDKTSAEDKGKLALIPISSYYKAKNSGLNTSINLLRYKQFTKSVANSKFNLASLPPTADTARHHTLRTYHQVQNWLGKHKDPEDWGWKKKDRIFAPVPFTEDPAPPALLKLISCRCMSKCGAACGCRKAGLKCSMICSKCSGESCENIEEVPILDGDDEEESTTNLKIYVEENSEFEKNKPGPSKRPRKQ